MTTYPTKANKKPKPTVQRHTMNMNIKKESTIKANTRPEHYITQSVKQGVYLHTMKDMQQHLSPVQYRFSRFIHSPFVETLSELLEHTFAKPIPIVGGSVVMVLLGGALLWIAGQNGFTLPYSTFILLYVGGYITTFIIELLLGWLRRR